MTDITRAEPAPLAEPTKQENPGAWIGRLLDSGKSPDDLKALFELYKEEREDVRRSAYVRAMAKFHADLPKIKRNCVGRVATGGGAGFSYSYADLPTIAAIVRPVLAKNGFSYDWTDAEPRDKHVGITCTLTHQDGYTKSSTSYMPVESSGGMSAQQKIVSATTFAQRNSLVLVLGLTTTADDIDGMDAPSRAETETITPEEVDSLVSLIEHTGTDRAKFTAYYRVQTVGDLNRQQYQHAVSELKKRAAR